MASDATTTKGAEAQLSKFSPDRWEPAFAWLEVGVGAAQLVAPRQVARLLGLPRGKTAARVVRLLGAREVLTGLGSIVGRSSPSWRLARLGGQALNLAALGASLATRKRGFLRRSSPAWGIGSALVGVAAVTALDALGYRRATSGGTKELAEDHPLELRAAVTIDRPAAELYSFWRNVENLPKFMPQVGTVTQLSNTRSRWEAKGVAGKVLSKVLSWEAEIVEDIPGELIGWKVEGTPAASLVRGGEVRFVTAPGKQGTEVHVVIQAAGPEGASTLGRWAKKLPQRFLAHELRLFKQLMELGELTQAKARFDEAPKAVEAGSETRDTSAAETPAILPTPAPGHNGKGQRKEGARP